MARRSIVWLLIWIIVLLGELLRFQTVIGAPYTNGELVASVLWIAVTLTVGAVVIFLTK